MSAHVPFIVWVLLGVLCICNGISKIPPSPPPTKFYHVRYTVIYEDGTTGAYTVGMTLTNPTHGQGIITAITEEIKRIRKENGKPAQWVLIDNLISP